jgi:hypothetical protein
LASLIPGIYAALNRLAANIWIAIGFNLDLFYSIGIIMQFSATALALKDRLRKINEKISSKYRMTSYDIRIHFEVYEELFKIISEINDHMTIQVFKFYDRHEINFLKSFKII